MAVKDVNCGYTYQAPSGPPTVCDTLVALGECTSSGVTIFAKNSDREPNEAQVIEYHPRRRAFEDRVKCTYVEVEQVDEVYAVLISRPYWMWGAEMGVNEHAVAIGNEAVFTRGSYAKVGLTGMDLVRLALERSRSASEAVHWIAALIEEHGQGGSCSATRKLYYHNSFLVADPREAWVLEAVGREWVAERVRGVRSISNALSIEREWDLASEGVRKLAASGSFSFAGRHSDRFYTWVARGRERWDFTRRRLEGARGSIDFRFVAGLLRSHSFEPYDPSRGSNRDVCMHAGGPTRPSQTASSMIALLHSESPVVFVTGTSTPCISAFKPVFLDAGLPHLGPEPGGKYDGGRSYWWRHEALSRRLLFNYRRFAPLVARDMLALEEEAYVKAIAARESHLRGEASPEDLRGFTLEVFEAAAKIEERWLQLVEPGRCLNPLYTSFWGRTNREAGLTP